MIHDLAETNSDLMYEGASVSSQATDLLNRNNSTLVAYNPTNKFGIYEYGSYNKYDHEFKSEKEKDNE